MDYKIDQLALRESQEQRVSVSVAELEQVSLTPPLAFVKGIHGLKKIRERRTEVDIQFFIWAILVKIAGYAGVKKEIPDLDKEDIMRMLFVSFSDLSVEEIYRAFELERYGELGEKTKHYDSFNADYVSDVLRKYKNWRQNTRIANNLPLLNPNPEKSTELSEEEKDALAKQGVISAFNHYKETSELPVPNFWIFDYLYEKGIIEKPTTPEIQEKYEKIRIKAEDEIKSEIEKKKSINFKEQLSNKKIIEDILNGKSNLVISRSKKIAVEYFFNDLILNSKSLTEILNK